MRRVLVAGIATVAALVLATLLARHPTRQAVLPPAAQPREARLEDLARDVVPANLYARAHSFWGETCIGPCAIGAQWAAAEGAAFATQIRLTVRAAFRMAAVPAPAAAWIAPEQLELAGEGEAVREVAMEPGVAPVVRVLQFRPRPKPARPERRYDTLRAA